VRLKISLNGILDALDEAHTRISELEVVNTALNTVSETWPLLITVWK
jgi:hypothetical protein